MRHSTVGSAGPVATIIPGPFFRGLPARVLRLRQNRGWHFDSPRGLAVCDTVEAGPGRGPRKIVWSGRCFGRGPNRMRVVLVGPTSRASGLALLGRSRRWDENRSRPAWGPGLRLAWGPTRRKAASRRTPKGLASTGRAGPVFPPEPRSRCRGREGREGWSGREGRTPTSRVPAPTRSQPASHRGAVTGADPIPTRARLPARSQSAATSPRKSVA